ncbi:MAG: NUDIX domain-containing protein [Rickettsiales bacterium]|jgi:isopentenyldiphosphate isomerase|nr:NUDIX domain-containing protein [Rickettsiales bacterium]
MELLDIYDESENLIGTADRAVAHRFGLWHKTVHCWLLLPDGRVVFQKRGRRKKDNPSKLYTSASGHVAAGEPVEKALAREVSEELGASPKNPRLIWKTLYKGDFARDDGSLFHDRAIVHIFSAAADRPLDMFRFDDGEADAVAAIDPGDFARLAQGLTDAIAAQAWDGGSLNEISVGRDDFLLLPGDTLQGKYQLVFDRIFR